MRWGALLVLIGSVGCAAPASVDGVFHNSSFQVHAADPLMKATASGRDKLVVLSEHDSETLRAVNLTLVGVDDLALDTPAPIGDGVEAIEGHVVIDTRADGVEVVSSENDTRAQSTGGTVTLTERTADALSGTFQVDLDDGGYLDGVFTAFPSD